MVNRIDIKSGRLWGRIPIKALSDALEVKPSLIDADSLTFTAPFTIKRRGIEAKIVCGTTSPTPDQVLIREIARAFDWRKRMEGGCIPKEIADQLGWTTAPIRKRIKLAFLSPRIVQSILDGTQPANFSVNALIHDDIPLNWADQEEKLGLSDPI